MYLQYLTDAEDWLSNAPAGAKAEYFRGNLQVSREALTRPGRSINAVAELMFRHSGAMMPSSRKAARKQRLVNLYQVRHGEFDYSYMAQKVRP